MAEAPAPVREPLAEEENVMTSEEIVALFIAVSMREYEKRGMTTNPSSTNYMLAEINGRSLAKVLSELRPSGLPLTTEDN